MAGASVFFVRHHRADAMCALQCNYAWLCAVKSICWRNLAKVVYMSKCERTKIFVFVVTFVRFAINFRSGLPGNSTYFVDTFIK